MVRPMVPAPSSSRRISGPRGLLRRFVKSRSGVAAIEFAMVLPLMLMMYIGMVEVTIGVNTDRKVILLSRTIADLVARGTTITDTEMNGIFAAGAAVLAPYDASQTKIVVSSIHVTENSSTNAIEGKVCWSEARRGTTPDGGSARSKGQVVNVPEGFQTPDSTYILVEVESPYTPMLGHAISGTITLGESTPWPVRNGSEVARSGRPTCL